MRLNEETRKDSLSQKIGLKPGKLWASLKVRLVERWDGQTCKQYGKPMVQQMVQMVKQWYKNGTIEHHHTEKKRQ